MHQNMDHRRRASWSELPPELLSMIANRLDAPMDFLGFRSVCSSWRSSTSPPGHDQSGGTDDLPSPPKFPCPFDSGKDVVVSESTIYRLEPLHDDHPDPSNSSSIPAKAFLVKVEVTKAGEYPLHTRRGDGSPSPIPKVLCSLDYRMVKLGKSNGLNYLNHNTTMAGVSKVIRYPDTASIFAEDCSIFVIYDGGKLGFAKRGDQELTLVDPGVSDYNDLIVHRGKLYVVDGRGTVSWMNYSSLKLTQISPTPSGSGARKHLVESGGELYVVDRYFETKEQRLAAAAADAAAKAAAASEAAEKQAPPHRPRRCRVICRADMPRPRPHPSGCSLIAIRGTLPRGKTVDFKVYKLNKECGTWTEVTDLGDEAFFLSDDVSLSVSATEFEGCKKNCIYFKNRYESSLFSYAGDCCVFSLEDRSIQIFRWPMPLCYSNPQFNTRLWILDCSNIVKPPMELRTPTAS